MFVGHINIGRCPQRSLARCSISDLLSKAAFLKNLYVKEDFFFLRWCKDLTVLVMCAFL